MVDHKTSRNHQLRVLKCGGGHFLMHSAAGKVAMELVVLISATGS